MKRTKTVETAGDLFSETVGVEASAPTALIASPLVTETAGWLECNGVLSNLILVDYPECNGVPWTEKC